MDITVRKLEASDDANGFDCGTHQLNEYLKKYARQDQRRMFGTTYVAVCCDETPTKVIGYFTIAATSIPRVGLSEHLLKGIPKYQNLPAFLLGRLAVDKAFQHKQIGELLLSKCFEHCLAISKCVAARYLIAEALLSAVTWYERYNFRKVEGSGNPEMTKMFVDLQVVLSSIDKRNENSQVN
jgi:GNAT superfamily N-acetyltransferase